MAKAVKACKPELRELGGAKGDTDLYRLYWDNVIFCIGNDFPNYRWMLGNMPNAAENGILINKHVKELPAAAVILGTSITDVSVTGLDQCRYWVRHQSSINIQASGRALVVVDAYDSAAVNVTIKDKATVKIFTYGNNHITIAGDKERVSVIEKSLNNGK